MSSARPPEFLGDAPGGDEVPVVGWPFLFEHRLRRFHSQDRSPWLVLIAVLTGLFATGFTITILAVSLQQVATDLHTTSENLTWVVTGPLLGLALLMPLMGKIGDTRGHRGCISSGSPASPSARRCTALAWNGPSLIAIRTIGSLPGAAIGPASMALIMQAFPEQDRVKAMGWWSLVGAGAPVIGLVAGGPMVDAFGWRAIFIAQVPVSLLALGSGVLRVEGDAARVRTNRSTSPGAATLAGATVAALLALTFGARVGYGRPIVLALAASAPLLLWWFVRCERRAAHPLLPLRFFTVRNFSASLGAQFCVELRVHGWVHRHAAPGPIPVRVHRSPMTSWAMACRPLTFSVTAPASGYLAARVGERRTGLTGTMLLVTSMGIFADRERDRHGRLGVRGPCACRGWRWARRCRRSSPSSPTRWRRATSASRTPRSRWSVRSEPSPGIQVLSTIQGGSTDALPFTAAYLVGGAIAIAGVVAAELHLAFAARPTRPDRTLASRTASGARF